MGRVVHFEIPSKNPEMTANFYKKVFGWKIEKWGEVDYWLATTGPDSEPGINGAIIQKAIEGQVEGSRQIEDASHAVNAVITIDVKSLDDSVKKIEENGGKIVMPKWPVKGIGWVAYFIDPDGNILAAMQADEKAE